MDIGYTLVGSYTESMLVRYKAVMQSMKAREYAWHGKGVCLGKTCMTPTNSVGGSCECRPTFEQTS